MKKKAAFPFSEKPLFVRFCAHSSKKLSSVNKGTAIGALNFGGVCFVSADFDSVKGAAVAILAVVLAIIYIAADVGICFSHKNASLK